MLHCRFNVLFNLYLNLKFLISMSLLSDRYNCFRKALMIFHNHKKLRNRGCLSNISHSTTWKKENKFESKKKKKIFFFSKIISLNYLELLKYSIQHKTSHRNCSMKKSVIKNFTKFTGKHLYQSLFFNNVAGLRQLY